jgi:alditol oxidase
MELTNWAGNLAYRAASLHYPTSVVAVQELVAQLPRVKALGTRHSFNTIADSPGGALISLSELAPEVTIDAEAMTVSAVELVKSDGSLVTVDRSNPI